MITFAFFILNSEKKKNSEKEDKDINFNLHASSKHEHTIINEEKKLNNVNVEEKYRVLAKADVKIRL